VLDAIAREHSDLVGVHPDGKRDLDYPVRPPDDLIENGIDLCGFGDGVELRQRLTPETSRCRAI
jgi:hypothetical protein